MAHVFLSYSKEDRTLAERVVAGLRREGLTVWWDDDLTPRASWDATIEAELDQAGSVLVLWTANSIRSEWVKSEADVARLSDPPKLVQARFDECRVPLGFNRTQYVDLDTTTPDRGQGWSKLLGWLRGAPDERSFVTSTVVRSMPAPPKPHAGSTKDWMISIVATLGGAAAIYFFRYFFGM